MFLIALVLEKQKPKVCRVVLGECHSWTLHLINFTIFIKYSRKDMPAAQTGADIWIVYQHVKTLLWLSNEVFKDLIPWEFS